MLIIFALFLHAQPQLFVPPLPEMSYAPVTDKSKFLGDRWSYMEAGRADAPVIIALHGYGGSSFDWRYQMYDLSDTYRVIAWNAPGYMLSDELKTNYPNAKDYADALNDFLTSLKINQVYLIGNSFGSRIAQCFAFYYPEKVLKMALVGPSAGKQNIPFDERSRHINMRYEQVKDGAYAFANKRVENLLAPNTSPEMVEVVRQGMRGVNPNMFMKGVNFLLSEDHYPDLFASKLTMPILIIAGTEDKISPIPLNAEPLSKKYKNSTIHILKNIGHLPHLESYEQVNSLVRDFFGVVKPNLDIPSTLTGHQLAIYHTLDSIFSQVATLQRNKDIATLKLYYADDCIITHFSGQTLNKETILNNLKSGKDAYEEYDKKVENFKMPNDRMAIIVGKEKVRSTNQAKGNHLGKPINLTFTEVWVYRDGRWQTLLGHLSKIP